MIRKITIVSLVAMFTAIPVFSQQNQKINIDPDVQLIHLQDSIFVHVTWHHSDDYGRFSSNGMIIVKNGQALMIDTPMDIAKTEKLTRFLKDSMSVDLTKLIVGHFHNDCMGGLEYLQSIGVESVANSMTIEKCKELGLPVPSTPFNDSLTFSFQGEEIDCRYFGAGHSFDNITVWLPYRKILFGGCLIKSIHSRGLGNLADAVVADWDATVEKVMKRYQEVKVVVPGHGPFGGMELLTHTIELVKKINPEAANPAFKESVKNIEKIEKSGLVVYYSNRCPFSEYHVTTSLPETARKRNLPLKVFKLETVEQAQSAPTPATIFSLFYDGEFVTTDISVCMDSRFDKVMEKHWK